MGDKASPRSVFIKATGVVMRPCESLPNHGVSSGSIGVTILGVLWAVLTHRKLYDPKEANNLPGNTLRKGPWTVSLFINRSAVLRMKHPFKSLGLNCPLSNSGPGLSHGCPKKMVRVMRTWFCVLSVLSIRASPSEV